MRSFLIFVIVSAAFVLAARYAYHNLRPPVSDARQNEDVAHVLASLPQSCHRATPPKPTSESGQAAQNYDLSGLKLYIPIQEAIASVSKLPQFKAPPEVSMRTCLSDDLHFDSSARATDKPGQVTRSFGCVAGLTYRSPSETLKLDFVEDVPDQLGCMIVKQVSSDRDVALSDDKAEARLKETLEKKYGPLGNQSTLWGEYTGAHLMLTRSRSDIQLDLEDSAFTQEKDDAHAKLIADASEKAKEEAKRKRKH